MNRFQKGKQQTILVSAVACTSPLLHYLHPAVSAEESHRSPNLNKRCLVVYRPRHLQKYGRARQELAQELKLVDVYWDDLHLLAPLLDHRTTQPYNLRPRRIIALTVNGRIWYYDNRLDNNHRPIKNVQRT